MGSFFYFWQYIPGLMAIGNRERNIIRASKVSIAGNAFLSVLKITVGLIAGSLAVVADGVDSASDIATSLVTLYTAYIIAKPPDPKFPYGYNKADTIATKVLAFIIFFAGAQLAITSVTRLMSPSEEVIPGTIVIYIIIISIIGKLLLANYLKKVGKSVESAMLIANARNMKNDVVISLSVLVGLIFTFVFDLPIIDRITALGVSVYIMIIAFRIFMQTNVEMMDGIEDKEIYKKIIDVVKGVEGASNPHRIRVRKMAHLYLVALDVEIDGDCCLSDAHKIGMEVESELKKTMPNIYDVLLHLEPKGNIEPDEVFGVSEKNI